MFTRSPKFLLATIAIGLLSLGANAQLEQDQLIRQSEELRKTIDHSIKTATFENGELTSFRVEGPNGIEKVVTVVVGDDKRSFTMFDGVRGTKVALEDDGRLSSMVLPDGKQITFKWLLMPNGYWVPASIKADGKDISRSDFADCSNICRQAAAASAIAVGVCAAAGPLSTACWSATASAAYLTYSCYVCVYPECELVQKNESILAPSGSRVELWTRKE